MNQDILQEFIDGDDELSVHRDYLKKLTIPNVDITISSDIPKDHDSRFAGSPLVSDDFVWPSHDIGEYRFLGQINFADIKNGPDELPKKGVLSMFYAYDEDGEIFWGDDGYVLGFYWPDIEQLHMYPDSANHIQAKKIGFEVGVEIPRHSDLRNDWPFDTEALYDLKDLGSFSEDYLLGYPSYFTLAYDPTPGEGWISLITLTSYDELEWCWHDGDKLMVFIEKERLAKQDFGHLKADAG
ncbi:YwqG family protein [Marinobacter zhejiangensis]|uniref:Uncharacterized protein YwqG n=1 Tax=Marinobacter zhejiangensis TaxID=488535 RepID=A0A1I4P507_9GAMM|nr:DUF1963 domain-containing protein [Marinobacter zhejiangensis]SFM22868.1 Uncharacterized protein YwqG [Marinobacter zhejiangensis]